jgi:hypothetical protein
LFYKSCFSVKINTLIEGFAGFCSQLGSLNGESDVLGNSRSVFGVDLEEMSNEAFLDVSAALAESSRDVVDDALTLDVVEDLTEEPTSLLVVVVGVVMSVTSNLTVVVGSVPGGGRILDGTVSRVRLVVDLGSLVSIDAHLTVADHVRNTSAVRAVDRDLLVVGSKSVSVSIGVREKTSLEHLVERSFDSGNQVRGRESGLLSLSVEVFGVAVKNEFTNIHERVVGMGPDLGNVVYVKSVSSSVSDRHHLYFPAPRGEVSIGDVVEEIVGGEIFVLSDLGGGFFRSEVLDSLVGFEMVLNQEFFVVSVNPFVGVRGVSIQMSESLRSSTVRHEDSDLVKGLRSVGPEIELHVGIVGSLNRARLLRVDEVGELNGVFNEEDGGVVSDHVVVAFLGVELNSESTGVSDGIRSTSLTSDSGETEEARSALTNLVEEVGLGKFRHITGDFKVAVGSSSLSMDDSLGNSLSVEMSELVNEVEVLEDNRSVGSNGHAVLVVGNGRSA